MMWLVQQSLPKIAIPSFDSSPLVWIKFVSKFKDLVHDQVHLRDEQRMFYLTQHLKRPTPFQQFSISVCADIKAMFHQVRVTEPDTDELRFLWNIKDPLYGTPDTYKMLVYIFGAKDLPCCVTYTLQKTTINFADKFSETVKTSVLRNFYANDFLKSSNDEKRALQVSTGVKDLLQLCGFRLTQFISNSQLVLNSLPQSDVLANSVDLSFENAIELTLEV